MAIWLSGLGADFFAHQVVTGYRIEPDGTLDWVESP